MNIHPWSRHQYFQVICTLKLDLSQHCVVTILGTHSILLFYYPRSLDEALQEPESEIIYPVYDSLDNILTSQDNRNSSNNHFVAFAGSRFYWRDVMKNIMIHEAYGLVAVFESECSESFTYKINCFHNGKSKRYWCNSCFITSGDNAFSPWNGLPGVACTNKNTNKMIANKVGTAIKRRFRINFNIYINFLLNKTSVH